MAAGRDPDTDLGDRTAAVTGGVKVVGARQLRRTLKAAGSDLSELKDVHSKVGSIVVAAGRTGAPRRSGALAGSVRASRAAASATVRAGSARAPYAGPIHWGWPRRGIRAQPFLSDAATSTEPAWTAVYEQAIDQILATVKGA